MSDTTGVDAITGAAGSDIITGVSSALSSAATLNAGDKIDGGVGNDTLKVDLQSNFAGFSSTGGVSNVETVELTNNGAIARSFDAKGVTGVQDYVLNGEVSLQDLASTDAAITLNGQQKNVTLGFASAAVSGSADVLNLNLNNVGTAADATAGTLEARPVVTASGIETLNLGVAGTNVVNVNDVQAKSVVAAGTGALDIGFASAAVLKTVDASAVTGDVTVDLGGLTGATTVATGAGDDTITAGSGDLALNATLAGGDGNDTLALNGVTGPVQYQMSGVETVSLGNLDGNLTFSAAKSTGIQTIEATDSFAANTATFAGLGSSDIAFDLKGANTNSGSITADQSGASTITVTASDATIQAADATASGDANNVALNLSNSSSVNLSVGEYASYQGTITAGRATSVEISGNVSGSTVDAATATAAVLNTTGDSSLTLNAGKLTDLSANVAAVTAGVSGGLTLSGLAGVQSLTANVGANSTLNTGSLTAINSINLSGAGQAVLDGLGSVSNDYGVSVTATGLENPVDASGNFVSGGEALTIGNINVGAGQTINLNVAGVAGNVSGGALSAASGSITVNANGTHGDVTLGVLSAKTVTVDASNVAGTVDLSSAGAITASGSLSIKADAVTDGVKLGALSGGSVTVDAQNVTLDASGASTIAVSGGAITATTGSINVNVDGAQGDVVFGTVSGAKDVIVDAANVAGTVSLSTGATASGGSIDINVSGATKDVTLGALTSTAKNVSVDASDALGVVQVDTVNGSATSGSIDINVSGATKAVTLSDLIAKDVTVDATDALGAVTVGDVTAVSGSIDINANGTTGLVTLDALSAKNVTVDATDALKGVIVGNGAVAGFGTADITVGDTLVFNGSDLKANSADISATGASLNATLNGGIQNDIFNISGGTTTLKYTVAGDLEIGANTVSVNASAQVDSTKSVTIDVSGLKVGTDGSTTLTGGSGGDTIIGSAGNDEITGGKGADVITLGTGTDTVVQASGDGVAATAVTVADSTNHLIAAGDTFTFGNGADVVNGFTAGASGDVLDLGAGTPASSAIGLGSTTTAQNYFLSGAWNATAHTFTVAADGSGADTLIVQGDATSTFVADVNAVVLVGVDSDNLVAANFA